MINRRPEILERLPDRNRLLLPNSLYTKQYRFYSVMKALGVVLSLALATFIVGWALVSSFISSEIVTCKTLQAQSKQYPLFYITKTDKEMCDHHEIWIDAPVLNYDKHI